MIDYHRAKKYCCEDISLIENYDKASKDLLETWDIHHRMEDEGYSVQELIKIGHYYHRPASELIFLTHAEHISLHGKNRSVKTRRKISEAKKGNKYWLGKHHSDEAKRKISEAMKGKKNCLGRTGEKHPMFGRTGEKNPKSKPIHQIDKNTGQVIKTWPCTMEVQRVLGINNGHISKCCLEKIKSCGGYIWRYV